MDGGTSETSGLQIETGQFLVAAVFIGVGGLMAFTGFIIGFRHAFSQGLGAIGRMEKRPNELARAKMKQAVAAATAAANAWKGLDRPDVHSVAG